MATDDNARDRAHARRSLGTHKEDADYGLLKGAAAVIAGAAFLRYQPGGRIVTRALGRTHQFVKNVGKTIDREVGKDITDMSLRDWQTVRNNLSSDWAKATRETDRVALDPNAGSLSHFVEGIETTLASNVTGKFGHKNISQTAYQTFMKDVVGKQMKDEVAAHLNLSRNDRIKFNAFISQVEKAPMSTLSNRQYMDRMQFTAEQQVHAENILKVMRARAEDAKSGKDLAAKDYMERIDHFLTKAKEDAYTLESLERNLGTLTKMDRDIGKIVGSRKATIGDILDNAQAVQDHTIRKVDGSTQSMLQWIRDYESKLNDKEKTRFRNLLVDAENLRVTQQGEFFSQKTGRGWYEDLRNFWAGTMPGQLFKLRELQTQDTVGSFQWFTKTMNNPILKAKLEKMGDSDNYHYRIGKDIYSMDEQGNTKLVIEDAKMVSGRVGFFHGQLEAMSGLYKIKESDNAALRWLDLFQDREHYSGSNIANFFSRFGENRRQTELVDLLRNPNFEQSRALGDSVLDLALHGENATKQSIDYVYQYGEILRKAERVLQTNTYQIDEHLLDQLSSKANQDSKVFFDLLKKDTRDIEDALLDPAQPFQLFEGFQFLNPKLRSLMDSLRRDPTKTRNTYELVTDPERLLISTAEESAVSGSLGNQTLYYEDILRKELGKEAILRQGLEGTSRQGKNLNYDNINALIDQIQGNPNSIKELRKLTQTAIFQHNTGIAGSIRKEPYELLQQIASARAMLQGTSDSERSFQAAYDTIMKDEIGWLEASQIGDATPGIGSLDEFVYINRTTTPLDLISGLNEAILQKSMNPLYNRASSFANQFLAGRGNMEYVSEITMAPYFMLKRLSDELNTVGLGFSGDNLGSTVDLASAIMTKRVLPIGLGLTYFDWLDDTTREVTGQSLSGAFVNGIANVDLAGRRVISGLGLDEWIREEKNINPILQYWFEKDEYQGYEERKDYYERGYDPVRKSAW